MSAFTARSCNKCHSGVGVLLCSRCKSVGYCSKACQVAQWTSGHKEACEKGKNTLAGTAYVAFPPEGEDRVGAEKFKSFDNDVCNGAKACDLTTVEYLSDAKYGKYEAGKPTVVLFWAQYHKPGYKFLPMYSILQAKYGSKVQFIAVSVDPDNSYPKKFLADPAKKYSTVFTTEFAVAHDVGHKLKEEFGSALRNTLSLPHAFVVDNDNTIVWHQDHSELGATVPNYMNLMEQQLDALVAGKPLVKVGEKEVESEEEDEGEEMDLGDMDDMFF